MAEAAFDIITENAALETLVADAIAEGVYAIDTEFHRERTYFPQVALVQVAVGEHVALVDPLAVDLKLMAPLFASDALAVLHAGRQDLEIFELTTGVVPSNLIDTQIAAGFLGYSAPSLATLLEKELGV